MRVLGLAIVSAIAACYSPGYRDCEITCASGACPSGYVCDQGTCRVEGFSGACGTRDGGSDVGTADDRDGDGVANDADNCPDAANANQANEDRDDYGDVCDPCPIGPGVNADSDSDGDGVGAACDPDPNMGGDSIALFEGFADTATPPGAMPVTPDRWMFPGEHATGISTQNIATLLTWPAATVHQEVRASVRVTALDNMPLHGVGLVGPLDPATNSGVICWILGSSMQITSPTGQTPYMQTQVPPIDAGKTYAFRMSRNGGDLLCREDGIAGGLTATVPPSQLTGGQAGVFVENATAEIDWILVVNESR